MNVANILFARTRHNYQSYTDYWRLVELSGFTWRYVDEINWHNPALVVIGTPANVEWHDSIPADHSAYLIQHYLERGASDDSADMAYPHKHPLANEWWLSDQAYATQLGAKYVFLGGHPEFAPLPSPDDHYRADFTTLAYINNRRAPIVKALVDRGLRCADLSGGAWGVERTKRLHSSKLIINVHQDDKGWHEPLRFMIAACYGIPLLSETCADPGLFTSDIHFVSCALDSLTESAIRLLHNDTLALLIASQAYRLSCVEHDFRTSILGALT